MSEHKLNRIYPDQTGKSVIDIDGLQVHCLTEGIGKPVLFFLHGSFLSVRSWRFVFERLSERYTVIAIDRPAFGRTDRPIPVVGEFNPYSPEGQADLVVAILEKLGHRQAVLVGNSTGGTIALLTALRYPDKISGLVLADSMVYSGYATSEFPAWLYPVFKAATPAGAQLSKLMIGLVFNKLHRTFRHETSRPGNDLLTAYRRDLMQGRWGRAFWELLLSSHNLDLEAQLGRINVPALVITGAQDRMVKPEETIRLSRALSRALLQIIPDCGHLPQEEKPDIFIAAVSEFLDKHIGA